MDDIIFYQPPSASISQPPRLPGAVSASNAPSSPVVCLYDGQTVSRLNQHNGTLNDQIQKSGDGSDPSAFPDQDLITTRKAPISDDDDLLMLDELWSGVWQESRLASADPNGDEFSDIDEMLSSLRQKNVPTKADIESSSTADTVGNGTRGSSTTDFSHSTAESSQVPIILSDDRSAGAESENDYSDFHKDIRAKSDCDLPQLRDSALADGFGSGVTIISDRLVTDDHGNNNRHNRGADDKVPLRLSAGRPVASPYPGPSTQQASKLQVDTDKIQECTSLDELDVAMGLHGEDTDTFAAGDNVVLRSSKGRTLSTVSDKNLATVSNNSRLQDGQPDNTRSPRLVLAATSLHRSDLGNDHLPEQLRQGATRDDHRKHPRSARAVCAVPEAADLKQSNSRVQIMDPEMLDPGSDDDSDDDDYADISDFDSYESKRGCRSHSWKRGRWAKDKEYNDVDSPPTHPLDVSCQAAAATSYSCTQESEELPIHGYIKLKTDASQVLYCVTFSQALLPGPLDQGRRQDCTSDLQESHTVGPIVESKPQWEIRKITGQKMIGRERHYRVEWEDTWMPESELAEAKELVDAFMRNDRGRSRVIERPLKRSRLTTGQLHGRHEKQPKKRRGRPRKNT